MSEKIKLVKWFAKVGEKEFVLNEREYRALLEADEAGRRFIALEGATINTAFVQSIERKIEYRNPEFDHLPKKEHKYITEGMKLLR